MSVLRTFVQISRGVSQVTWASLLTAETGNSADIPVEQATRSVHISGVAGAGGVVAIQGSNDGVNWGVLSSGLGAIGDLTALAPPAAPGALVRTIYENMRFVRPVVTAGDGTTDIKVIITAV